MFKSEQEIQTLLEQAGFAGEGGKCVVRREGRRCAIVKAVKFPIDSAYNLTALGF